MADTLTGEEIYMKIGDLVRLSAYGKKRKRSDWIDPEDVGIVIKVRSWPDHCDYIVKWTRSDYHGARKSRSSLASSYWHWEKYNQRKDLMYAK